VKLTVAWPTPVAVAVTPVGAPGAEASMICPILLLPYPSANQRAPSGPLVMPPGKLFWWDGVLGDYVGRWSIRPNLLASVSVNQRAPSGPLVMLSGLLFEVGTVYLVMASVVGSIRPIWLRWCMVNHRAPSGPFMIWPAALTSVK